MEPRRVAVAAVTIATLCGQAGILCNKLLFRDLSIHRVLTSLRDEILASQAALHGLQDAVSAQKKSLTEALGKDQRWATSHCIVLWAYEYTITTIIRNLRNAARSKTNESTKSPMTAEYMPEDQDIKDFTIELQRLRNAVQTITQMWRLKSFLDVIDVLDNNQTVFARIKHKAETRSSFPGLWDSPNVQAPGVYGILNGNQDEGDFHVDDDEVAASDTYQYNGHTQDQRALLASPSKSTRDDANSPKYEEGQDPKYHGSRPNSQGLSHAGPVQNSEIDLTKLRELDRVSTWNQETQQEKGISTYSLSVETRESSKTSATSVELFRDSLRASKDLEVGSSAIEQDSEKVQVMSEPQMRIRREYGTTPAELRINTELRQPNNQTAERRPSSLTPWSTVNSASGTVLDVWAGFTSPIGPLDLQELKKDAPLHHAAYVGDAKAVRDILYPTTPKGRLEVNPNSLYNNKTAISFAARAGHIAVVEALIVAGANPHSEDSFGMNAFHWAVICSQEHVLRLLFAKKDNKARIMHCEPGIVLHNRVVSFARWRLTTLAAYFGSKGTFQAVECSASGALETADLRNKHMTAYRSALHTAAANISYLLLTEKVSDENSYKSWYDSAFDPFWLCWSYLIKLKRRYPGFWSTAETEMCKEGTLDDRLSIVSSLLQSGFAISREDPYGFTALQAACCGVPEAMVSKLLSSGAKPELKQNFQPKQKKLQALRSPRTLVPSFAIDASPMHLAALWNRGSVIKCLARNGADPNAAGYARRRPLHYAAIMGNVDAINALLSVKATVDAGTCIGLNCPSYGACVNVVETPLSLAVEAGHLDAMTALIDGGESVTTAIYNIRNCLQEKQLDCIGYKHTILHRAVSRSSSTSAVELLLKHGADPNRLDTIGWTPLHNAVLMLDLKVAQLLLKYGADPKLGCHDKRTPLHLALGSFYADGSENLYEIVNTLLSAGAHPTQKDKWGGTALRSCQTRISEVQRGDAKFLKRAAHRLEDYEKVLEQLVQWSVEV